MSLPTELAATLREDEHVLWHSPANAAGKLSDFGGAHELIARLFFGLSAIMALVFFLGMQDSGRMGLSTLLLACVGGPILIGLGIRYIGRVRARAKAKATHYAVTSRRILVTRIGDMMQHATPIDRQTAADATLHRLSLPAGEAAKAEAAIAQAKAAL